MGKFRNLAIATAFLASGLVGAAAGPANADFACPSSGWACFYMDNDFNRNEAEVKAGYKISWTSSNIIWNQASAVRNRTGCTLYMWSGQNQSGYRISLAPYSEVARLGVTYGSYWNDQIESVSWSC